MGDPRCKISIYGMIFYHTHLPSPPCPRSSSQHSNLAPVALGKRLELNNSTVSGLRPGCLDSKWTYGIDIGRLLGIYGDQGDQESKQIKQRAFAQTARNKATKKIKKVKHQNVPIPCSSNPLQHLFRRIFRRGEVDAALQSPSAKHLRFQRSHPWWQSPCRSGKGCRSHQSCTWGRTRKLGAKYLCTAGKDHVSTLFGKLRDFVYPTTAAFSAG